MVDGNLLKIEGHSIERIEYHNQPVITLRMIDELHERPEGTAGRAFRYNREKFIENEDYFESPYGEWNHFLIRRNSSDQKVVSSQILSGHEMPDQNGGYRGTMTFLTQSGYLLLVKTFTDDRAWKVQRALIKSYFIAKQASLHDQLWGGLAGDPAAVRERRAAIKEQCRLHVVARAEAERIIKGRGSIDALDHAPVIQAAVRSLVENDPRIKYGRAVPDGTSGTGNARAAALVRCLDGMAAEYLAGPDMFEREYRIQFEPSFNDAGLVQALSLTLPTGTLLAAMVPFARHKGLAMPFTSAQQLGHQQNYDHATFSKAGWSFKRKVRILSGTTYHFFTKRLSSSFNSTRLEDGGTEEKRVAGPPNPR